MRSDIPAPGEVRRWFDADACHLARALVCDPFEVQYDAWWGPESEPGGFWGFARARTCVYYRVPASWWCKQELIGVEALTSREREKHRPDLPLRLLRATGWAWSECSYDSLDSFAAAVRMAESSLDVQESTIVLPLREACILPAGPHGGLQRIARLRADDPEGFRAVELLWKCHQLQVPLFRQHFRVSMPGAGLYRAGLRSGTPSYYLGGDVDRAEILSQ